MAGPEIKINRQAGELRVNERPHLQPIGVTLMAQVESEETAHHRARKLGLALGLVLVGVFALCREFVSGQKPLMVFSRQSSLPILGTVPDFTLTNQIGLAVSRSDLLGRIWLVDLIYTRCAGPCPKLSLTMNRLQSSLSDNRNIRLVSLTADPEHDTPAVMGVYAAQYRAETACWLLLTGDPRQLQRLAVDGLKLTAAETTSADEAAGEPPLIHSTRLVLIDQKGRIRGYYDGLAADALSQVSRAVAQLSGSNR